MKMKRKKCKMFNLLKVRGEVRNEYDILNGPAEVSLQGELCIWKLGTVVLPAVLEADIVWPVLVLSPTIDNEAEELDLCPNTVREIRCQLFSIYWM